MYTRKSRLSPRQQSRLLELFVVGSPARAASKVISINVKTATNFYMRLRKLIASKQPRFELSAEVEADESYFGGACKGKRGRGAAKVAVFGLLKLWGKVYTVIVPDAKTVTLLPIIEEKVKPDSIVYIDTFRSYNALDVTSFRHRRINHLVLFANQQNHINGIENL